LKVAVRSRAGTSRTSSEWPSQTENARTRKTSAAGLIPIRQPEVFTVRVQQVFARAAKVPNPPHRRLYPKRIGSMSQAGPDPLAPHLATPGVDSQSNERCWLTHGGRLGSAQFRQHSSHPSAGPWTPWAEGGSREAGCDDAAHGLAGRGVRVWQSGASLGRNGSVEVEPSLEGGAVVDEAVGAAHWISHHLPAQAFTVRADPVLLPR
jgi:hypothetical protein